MIQYMHFCDVCIAQLGINYAAWRKYQHSPIWLGLPLEQEDILSRFRSANLPGHEKEGNFHLIPLYLKTGVERDTVLDSLMEQILAVARLVAPEKLPPQ